MAGRDVAESWHVNPVRTIADDPSIRPAVELPTRPAPLDVIHDVAADLTARIPHATDQQNPRALEGRRAEENHAGRVLPLLFGLRVDNADAGQPVLPAVVREALHDAKWTQRETTGRARCGQRRVDAAEIRPRDAPPVARSTVVTGRASVVRLGEDGDASDCEHALAPEPVLHSLPDVLLRAVQRHRRQELAVRQLRQTLFLAADADEAVHVIVPWRDVGIANRPIDRDAVAQIGLEVEVAPAINLAAPDDRLAADLPGAEPVERTVRGRRVRVLHVIRPEDVTHFVERCGVALDRLPRRRGSAIAQPAEWHLPPRRVLDVVLLGRDRPSGLQHQRAQTELGQLLRCPAAGHPGPDDDRVEISGRHRAVRTRRSAPVAGISRARVGRLRRCSSRTR